MIETTHPVYLNRGVEDSYTARNARRVRDAALLLDQRSLEWADRIDLATLDLGDLCHCVLGQLYGDYLTGIVALYDNLTDSYQCDEAYAFTDIVDVQLWRAEIVRRRS